LIQYPKTLWPSTLGALAILVGGCGRGEAPAEGEATAKPTVEVSVAEVAVGDMRGTLVVTGALAPLANAEAKVAPLAPGRFELRVTMEQFGLARMFQSYRSVKGETGIRVFMSMEEAIAWLGLNEDGPPGATPEG